MKNLLLCLLFFSIFLVNVEAQQGLETRIGEIRKIYAEVTRKIEAAEKDQDSGEKSELAVNELVINKLNRSWAAVGNYSEVYRFYYQNKGEEPYPTQLLKVTRKTESAARRYYEEFVYEKEGDLIFYFAKSEESEIPKETRIYFREQNAIRLIDGENIRDKYSEEDKSTIRKALKDSKRVTRIFIDSIED